MNRATQPEGATVIGENCYLMAQSHVGHDCVLGERVVLANVAMVAGFVQIGRFSFMGGGAGIHQYNRIGEGVMIGGMRPYPWISLPSRSLRIEMSFTV